MEKEKTESKRKYTPPEIEKTASSHEPPIILNIKNLARSSSFKAKRRSFHKEKTKIPAKKSPNPKINLSVAISVRIGSGRGDRILSISLSFGGTIRDAAALLCEPSQHHHIFPTNPILAAPGGENVNFADFTGTMRSRQSETTTSSFATVRVEACLLRDI
jgi:hypothetical protein